MTATPEVVRVPTAWGAGGEAMAAAATALDLPFPTVATIEAESLEEQHRRLAAALPELPLVLGGCCCAHVGAVTGLAGRSNPIAVVWFDAHGDLNTPETSPSGNAWGMPYRVLLDGGVVRPEHAALLGARNLDQPEVEFIAQVGLETSELGLGDVLDAVEGVYIALDVDVFDPSQISCFMPEPNGSSIDQVCGVLESVRHRAPVVGMGLSGLVGDPANVEPLVRLCAAAGFTQAVR